MKFFRLSLIALGLSAIAAIADVLRSVRAWVVDVVAPVLEVTKPEHLPSPMVPLVQARAYVMRQAKRERPTVAPRWRMCPSA